MSGFVLGCHRSGTSLLAGILRRALQIGPGQTLGPDLPVSADNRLGFAESEAMNLVNEHLLDIAGTNWHQPFIARPAWEEANTLGYLASLRPRLQAHSQTRYWIDKDPRLCLTRDAVAHLLLEDVPAVAILRNPFEVAQSLYFRNGFPYIKGLAIWLLYNFHLFNCSSQLPYLTLSMHDLISPDPVLQQCIAAQLTQFLSICCDEPSLTPDDLQSAMTNHFHPSLLHCRSFSTNSMVDDRVFEAFSSLWVVVDEVIQSQQQHELPELFRTSLFRFLPLLGSYCHSPVRGHHYYQDLHALQDQLKSAHGKFNLRKAKSMLRKVIRIFCGQN